MLTRRQTLRSIVAGVASSGVAATTLAVAPARGDEQSPRTAGVRDACVTGAPVAHVADDVEAPSLHELVGAAAPWSSLRITRDWVITEPVEIAVPMTLRFDGGSIATGAHISLLRVTSSDVRVQGAVLRGADGTVSGAGRGIHVAGDPARPIRRVVISGGSIADLSHDGVLLEHVEDFAVSGLAISEVGYAGVLMFSCTDGLVNENVIDSVHQPAPYVNSYGIEAVRATTGGVDQFPRSARIVIADNVVRGVRLWEGIDTHGGEDIDILRNRVEDCRVGIALVPSKDEADATKTKYAPRACRAVGNTVTRSFRGSGSGIIVRGAGEVVDSPAERATGAILDNVVDGYGDGDRDAPILVYLTESLLVAGNTLRGLGRAVSVYHSNSDLTIARNEVAGLEPLGSSRRAGISVVATANSGVLVSNHVSAADVGILCRGTPNQFFGVANRWSLAGTEVVSATSGTVTTFLDQRD